MHSLGRQFAISQIKMYTSGDQASALLGMHPADTCAEIQVYMHEDNCSALFVVAEDWGQPDA